ncbi:alpha/beta hydrolase [Sphingobacteriales bacterium UPWRP_1]|nr:hypothetical protein B6N25_03450 [Sphingobacteriales bacterium TSM_CSS]PSJ76509.1 alpha/beta hydrolase [Sphingobacteriales bacterium UPWRP_1]
MASLQNYIVKQYVRSARNITIARKHHEDIHKMRRGFELIASRHPLPDNIYFKRFFIGNMSAAWILPHKLSPKTAMLYLHGGGYAAGSVNTHKALIAKITKKAGIAALAIDYRLAPEHPFPAALQDAVASYEYLLQQGYLPQNICIAGDSAGGGLTLATLLYLKQNNRPLPATAVCISPWTDLAITGASVTGKAHKDPLILGHVLSEWALRYAANEPTTHPLISPLYADLAGLPPILIQVGTDEVILDDSVRFAEKARQQGTDVTLQVWNDMIHVWHFHWRILPEANKAIKDIAVYLHKQIPELQQTAAAGINMP